MAYNLRTLVQILEQTLHPDLHNHVWILNDHDKSHLESLLELALSLEDILENLPTQCYKTTQALMSQIRDAAYIAEDIIEPYVADQILTNHESSITSLQFFRQPWRTLFHKHEKARESLLPRFSLLKDRLTKVVEQHMRTSSDNDAPKKTSVSSSRSPSAGDVVVGLENDLLQLQDRLTGHGTKLEVIPIVVMGGIGKSTLAQHLCNDPLIIYHFDHRAWATVSQEYNLTATLLSLLGSITGNSDVDMNGKLDDQLGELIYRSLSGTRYLVVLDDIWSIKVWDFIRRFFPQNNNGSRVMLTTRELSVANYANATSPHHQMNLLNEVESWNLLCGRVFGAGKSPPAELEYAGKSIANNCKGLPLAIQVVAGLLLEKQEVNFWQDIADDVSAVVARNDERCSKILFLSYEHLPLHLRSCFLYVGGFPEDYVIQGSEITKLFVAEGFLKPIKDNTLEEAAEEYLKALVDRSLLSVRKRDPTGKAKGYIIHDLIRDLCKSKAEEEKFISVRTAGSRFSSMRRLFIHPDHLNYNYHSTIINMPQAARSFVYTFPHGFVENRHMLKDFKLLRVLALLTWKFKEFPRVILKLVNIRYLALTCSSSLPSAISRLWNLQTLIFQAPMVLSSPLVVQFGLKRLTEIRHIKFMRSCYYPIFESGSKQFVLEKLQTLSYVDASKFVKRGFIEKVPNLKKLGMILGSFRGYVDLSNLLKLETLKCLSGITFKDRPILPGIIFPACIKKLYLIFCKITGKFMSTVGSLPNLEVLKIRGCTMLGEDMQPRNSKWEPNLGEFISLQFLQLDEFKLVHWQADERHYPSLQHLAIRKCGDLDDLPTRIGDIPTMEMIELDEQNPHLVASATRIREEQQDLGNDSLQILIRKGHSSNLWWTKYIYI